jgi:hypothetical protein
MTLFEKVIAAFPELANDLKVFANGVIVMQDDLDGNGAYIREWNYEKPLPEGLKIGK